VVLTLTLKIKTPDRAANVPIGGIFLALVPRTGVEPVRVASLVFETSASTYSATWAKRRANLSDAGARCTPFV